MSKKKFTIPVPAHFYQGDFDELCEIMQELCGPGLKVCAPKGGIADTRFERYVGTNWYVSCIKTNPKSDWRVWCITVRDESLLTYFALKYPDNR